MTRSINQNAAEVMVSQDSEHVWDSGEHHKLNGEARSAIAHLCEKGECAIEDLAQHLKVTPGHTRRLQHDAIENHLVRERITDAGGIVLSARHAVAALHAGAAKIRGKDVSGLKSTFLSGVGRYILTSVGAIALALGLSFGLGGRDVMSGILCGYYLRQRFQAGDRVSVGGYEGTVRDVGPVATIIETDDGGMAERRSIPNNVMLNDAVR